MSHRSPPLLTVMLTTVTLMAPSVARADKDPAPPAALAVSPDESDLCKKATAEEFKAQTDEIYERGRRIPEHDFYRDEAMIRARQDLEEARRTLQDWDTIEQEFLGRCDALRERRRTLAEIKSDLEALIAVQECRAFKQRLDGMRSTLHESADSIVWDIDGKLGQWKKDAEAPDFCAAGFVRVQSELHDWSVPIIRHLAAMLNDRREERALEGAYKTQARKRYTVDALATHHLALRAALEKDSGDLLAEKTVGKLPWIIVILGVFCLSIMVMVRRFERKVQLEWVRSGQVIQFMTVTIMIIVILALGLSGNLQKESLGTLLGTIGGYVLSNGLSERKTAAAPPENGEETGKKTPPPNGEETDKKTPPPNGEETGKKTPPLKPKNGEETGQKSKNGDGGDAAVNVAAIAAVAPAAPAVNVAGGAPDQKG